MEKETEKDRLLKEASIRFRDAKRLEFQLYKTLGQAYVLLMRAIYPDYQPPRFQPQPPAPPLSRKLNRTLGAQHDNAEKLEEKIKPET